MRWSTETSPILQLASEHTPRAPVRARMKLNSLFICFWPRQRAATAGQGVRESVGDWPGVVLRAWESSLVPRVTHGRFAAISAGQPVVVALPRALGILEGLERALHSILLEVYSKDGLVGFLQGATAAWWMAVQQRPADILESRLLPADAWRALVVSSLPPSYPQGADRDGQQVPADAKRRELPGAAESVSLPLAVMSPILAAGQPGHDQLRSRLGRSLSAERAAQQHRAPGPGQAGSPGPPARLATFVDPAQTPLTVQPSPLQG